MSGPPLWSNGPGEENLLLMKPFFADKYTGFGRPSNSNAFGSIASNGWSEAFPAAWGLLSFLHFSCTHVQHVRLLASFVLVCHHGCILEVHYGSSV